MELILIIYFENIMAWGKGTLNKFDVKFTFLKKSDQMDLSNKTIIAIYHEDIILKNRILIKNTGLISLWTKTD